MISFLDALDTFCMQVSGPHRALEYEADAVCNRFSDEGLLQFIREYGGTELSDAAKTIDGGTVDRETLLEAAKSVFHALRLDGLHPMDVLRTDEE